MPNKKSAEKRVRQNEKRRIRNSKVKASIRTVYKNLLSLLSDKGEKNVDEIKGLQKKFDKTIDTAARKNTLHWKTAARKKSRMAEKVNTLAR